MNYGSAGKVSLEGVVHLVDGTYELFRHFYGARRFNGRDLPYAAVAGVLNTVIHLFEIGATHVGVATDHIIESFRNDLWPDYKTGEGMDPALVAQSRPLEYALEAMGIATWPMKDLEADDGLASAAHLASQSDKVNAVWIWTPDKDLAQCVVGDRVIQIDRRNNDIRNEEGVFKKYGVPPRLIPDFLALVGDAADGYPGIPKIGKVSAARLCNQYGFIENFPPEVLGDKRELALLFKNLATLRTHAPLFANVDELRWTGPTNSFLEWCDRIGDEKLMGRCTSAVPA